MAIVTSATAVLFVGEIIPSAIFSGPHKLAFSAYLVPLVRVAMVMLFPVAWPLAKLLDVVLGSPEGPSSRFNRLQLQTIIRLHQVRGIVFGRATHTEVASSRAARAATGCGAGTGGRPYISLFDSGDPGSFVNSQLARTVVGAPPCDSPLGPRLL